MIKRTLLYALLFISALYLYRELLYTGLRKNAQGIFHKYNEMFLDSTRYDVLFMGSSRAEMHYNPRIFDSVTGLSSYNIGISGATPRINFAMLRAFCAKHPTPRYLVYDIDFYGLKYGVDTLPGFPHCFPYLGEKAVRRELQVIDPRFNSFYYNPLHSLPYTQVRYLSASVHGWLGVPGKYDSFCYKGYQTADPSLGCNDVPLKAHYSYIHLQKRAYIDSIIRFAKDHGIRLVLQSSPVYRGSGEVVNKQQLIGQLRNIAIQNRLDYHDDSEPWFCNDKAYFTDPHHLNEKGSTLFSGIFSARFHNIYLKFPLSGGK